MSKGCFWRFAFDVTMRDNALWYAASVTDVQCGSVFRTQTTWGCKDSEGPGDVKVTHVCKETQTHSSIIFSFHWTDTVICQDSIIFSHFQASGSTDRLLLGSFLRITTADVRCSWLGPWASTSRTKSERGGRWRCRSAWRVSVLTVPPFMTKAISVGWYTWPLKAIPGREVPWLPWLPW